MCKIRRNVNIKGGRWSHNPSLVPNKPSWSIFYLQTSIYIFLSLSVSATHISIYQQIHICIIIFKTELRKLKRKLVVTLFQSSIIGDLHSLKMFMLVRHLYFLKFHWDSCYFHFSISFSRRRVKFHIMFTHQLSIVCTLINGKTHLLFNEENQIEVFEQRFNPLLPLQYQ
jgi:hypothetical protein